MRVKRTRISLFVATLICLSGTTAWAAAPQSYSQQIGNCPQCYSSPQYQSYETVPQQVYYQGHESSVSYEPTATYQSPVVESPEYSSQIVYGNQVYGNQSYGNQIYSGATSYPTVASTPVYSSNVYQPQSYASQGFQTTQQSSNRPVVQQTTSYSGNYYTSTNTQPGLAQQKAVQAAQMSFRDHVGGSLGGAKYEGVGWSNQSPQTAIQNCCYWGQRPPAQIGVSKSQDGCWYACVLYN